MLAMGSVDQEQLACALRVEMKHLKRSYSRSVNFMLLNFRYIVLMSPHPPAFTGICGNAIHYACGGFCGSREEDCMHVQ